MWAQLLDRHRMNRPSVAGRKQRIMRTACDDRPSSAVAAQDTFRPASQGFFEK
jgi:hypothetical protein